MHSGVNAYQLMLLRSARCEAKAPGSCIVRGEGRRIEAPHLHLRITITMRLCVASSAHHAPSHARGLSAGHPPQWVNVGAERTAQRPPLSADEMHAGVWPVLDSTLAKHAAATLRKRSRSGLCLLDCSLFYQSWRVPRCSSFFLV